MRSDIIRNMAIVLAVMILVAALVLVSAIIAKGQTSGMIIKEAQSHLGTMVGIGNCRHFVNKVLKNTGTTVGPGDTVATADVRPGDIFLTAGFYRLITGYTFDILEGIGAHVAIVLNVLGDNRYEIMEQNADGKKVSIRVINLSIHGDTRDYGTHFLRPRPGKHDKAAKKFIKWPYK